MIQPLRTGPFARLWSAGLDPADTRKYVDSTAAAIILADFIDRCHNRKV